ncbi:LOW QUALITY PROTEIN: octanoyl-[acyl-carrier-protein]:protein N-octanoyltransferase LIPT2, mitochondrial-like, partial [Menidia menidia]
MGGARPLVEVVRLGLVPYQEGLRLQQVYVDRDPDHALLLCQHPRSTRWGSGGDRYPDQDLDRLRGLGAQVHRTQRGGLITFHGPGQLVCYPVLDLARFNKGVRWYVGQLEASVVSLCAGLGLAASLSPHTGVWIGDSKVCAIGIHVGRRVTSHGLALNVTLDLSWFGHIVPCGLEGGGVTSLSREMGRGFTVGGGHAPPAAGLQPDLQ